ncbi:M15 family metallopeptidase [Labrys sp. LIt4]|uniref:M15 family metallopeptidase n=1 Tax=Labrys sp. LIt4 TaxID=2821355 RepID=UPI001ADF1D18|nr:M15 family metallopeptidase [Labrys sp. LIt4]MBP0581672.1 M15 family metallopeptidase [Labrys sp. LIt4]
MRGAALPSFLLTTIIAISLFSAPALAADLPPGFVRLADVAPGIRQDMRYAGAHNFVGRPIAGYASPACWLRREVAQVLAAAARDFETRGWRLVVHDCYRPKRAVADFVAWAGDADDQGTKAEFYPRTAKSKLFALGYIARTSMHSKGIAVDVGAEQVDAAGQVVPLDFGGGFDLFDKVSWTASKAVSPAAAANRKALVAGFAAHGLVNYAREWWHFSLPGAAGAPAYDVVIREP